MLFHMRVMPGCHVDADRHKSRCSTLRGLLQLSPCRWHAGRAYSGRHWNFSRPDFMGVLVLSTGAFVSLSGASSVESLCLAIEIAGNCTDIDDVLWHMHQVTLCLLTYVPTYLAAYVLKYLPR